MRDYPKTKRDPGQRAARKTEEDQRIARQFGKEFFDGDRRHGYGGFSYHPRYWRPVVPSFVQHWNLSHGQSLLDVGCAKGFMLKDFRDMVPGLLVKGVDVSSYAIQEGHADVRSDLVVADARALPFDDNEFDYVISINTVHNLSQEECVIALKEIERVSRLGSFITVDAYRNETERQAMDQWNLTAKTILHVDEWKQLFQECGFTGDYYWFTP